jgi:hypothetical protein
MTTSTPALARTAPSPLTATAPPPARADHRAGPQLRALALVAGGVVFAVGNAMHPLRHDDAALEAPTWLAAHLVFGVGSVLMAAGLGVLTRRMAPSRVATVGLGVLWLGLVLMPIGGITEGYVAPAMGHAYHDLETSLLWFSSLAGTSTLLGPLLVAIGAVQHRLLPLPVALALPGITVGGLAVGVLPAEGYGIIPGTIVFGLGMAGAGWVCRRPV